jgi:hypothetical protein
MCSRPSSLSLPFTQELTLTSLLYSLRGLHSFPALPSNQLLQSLQTLAIQSAAELAFQRYLAYRGIPFEKTTPAPLSHPEQSSFRLGGRLAAIHTHVVHSLNHLQNDASLYLKPWPSRQTPLLNSHPLADAGLHIFALVLTSFARSRREASQSKAASQPVYWLYPLPERWRKPAIWKPLTPLSIQTKLDQPLVIEIGGRERDNRYKVVALELKPKQEAFLDSEFYSLSFLHTERLPGASLEIHSIPASKTLRITPDRWRNAWIYGQKILFMGYLEKPDWHAWQRDFGQGNANQLPKLNSLEYLFQNVVKWYRSVTGI